MAPAGVAASESGRGERPPAIELVGISKRFGPVQANKDIGLRVEKGTIHGIVGENGAGKSTLMSILYGFYQADEGEIRIDGKPVAIPDSLAAIRAGIGMVHQHFMLVEPFTVLENVVLGAEEGRLLRPSLARARAELKRLEEEYELDVDPDAVVGELSVGLQQRVEILKALYRECDILILDEPTGVLTPAEADHLFRILQHLKAEGKTIVLITHKLREIMAVTDAVSVMRRGEMVRTFVTAETSPAELAEAMVGRRVLLRVEKAPATPGEVLLEVDDLSLVDAKGVSRLKSVSLSLRAGEILGVAGVAGNGQSELLEVLAGIRPATSGRVRYKGAVLALDSITNADDRRDAGIAHIPEDRHRRGLIMPFAQWESSCLGYQHEERFRGPVMTLDRTAIRDLARASIEKFDVRPPSCDLKTANFSGGNQQKIVIAREMERDPDVLLVGQPTRGVDIGAIEFIHQQIVALRDRGKAILLVSVELDEIQALTDRIIVMFDGRISGERAAGATDERELGLLMAGMDTFTMLFLRFGIAALLMAVILIVRRETLPRGKILLQLIGMGALGYVGQSFSYLTAIQYASAGLVALLLYLYPMFVFVLSVIVLRERITWIKVAALVLALTGTALTVDPAGGQLQGILLAICAALIYSVYIIVGTNVMKHVSAVQSSLVIFASAGAVYGNLMAVNGIHLPASGSGWLGIVGIVLIATVIPVVTFLAGLERIGPTNAAMLSTLEPVVTVLLATWIFDERLNPIVMFGGTLILIAVVLLTRGELEKKPSPRTSLVE